MTPPGAREWSDEPWPVAAGLEIVDRSGFDDVSVRSVAARAGYTPMAVYRHVADVDDLLERIVRRVFEDWESRVYAVLDEGDPMTRLWRYAEVYREYAVCYPYRYEVLFVLSHGIGTHRFPEGFSDSPATTFRILVETVGEAMECGRLKADDPVEVGLLFWSTAHGLVTLERSGRFEADQAFTAFYRRSIRRLLGAMGGVSPETAERWKTEGDAPGASGGRT